MRGVMDLRGKIVPIIDLRRKFGLPAVDDTNQACIMVISVEAADKKPLLVGALVDDVSEVVTIDEDSVEAVRTDGVAFWERYVRGFVRFEKRMIVIIEADGLFSLREFEALRVA
jgi:purine-binding chemotaxis protein CheW